MSLAQVCLGCLWRGVIAGTLIALSHRMKKIPSFAVKVFPFVLSALTACSGSYGSKKSDAERGLVNKKQFPSFAVEGKLVRVSSAYDNANLAIEGTWNVVPTKDSQLEKDFRTYNVIELHWVIAGDYIRAEAKCKDVENSAQNNIKAKYDDNSFEILESEEERLMDAKTGNMLNCYVATSATKYSYTISDNELILTKVKK